MSKNTHAIQSIRNGVGVTKCGKTFRAGEGSSSWFHWGTCSACARIVKQEKRKR